jgi:hypothetical protein
MAGSGSKNNTPLSRNARNTTADDFAQGGEAREMAEAWVPAQKGEAILGRLVRVTDIPTRLSKTKDDKAPLAEFGPVVIRDEAGKKKAYASIAVVLGASLRHRIHRDKDIGQVFALIYDGTMQTDNGTMHVYNVLAQPNEKLAAELQKLGASDDLPF